MIKKKICIGLSMVLLFSILGNINHNDCYAEDRISLKQAEQLVENVNKIIENSQEELCEEIVDEIVESNELEENICENSSWSFGLEVNADSIYKQTYKQWTALTNDEKVLIACEPKKALATKSLSKKAYKMTEKEFGYNGLGDKSDGFRHGVWNALMTRDITRAWAKSYATAHESGKTKKQLEKKASDGYTEKQHRNMDLHNNSIGRSVIKWYDTIVNVSDRKLKQRVKNKLTNKKKTGIYWLHD